MDQIKFDTTPDVFENIDMDIDFYDIKSTTKWGIAPLPMNKTSENFREILLQQITIEQDIYNKKCALLKKYNSDSTNQETRTLVLKYLSQERLYMLRHNEIITVLRNLAS